MTSPYNSLILWYPFCVFMFSLEIVLILYVLLLSRAELCSLMLKKSPLEALVS